VGTCEKRDAYSVYAKLRVRRPVGQGKMRSSATRGIASTCAWTSCRQSAKILRQCFAQIGGVAGERPPRQLPKKLRPMVRSLRPVESARGDMDDT